MIVTSDTRITEADLVPGAKFRYKWKGKKWITLEVMRVQFGKVQCTPPTTNLRHRFIKLEDVLATGRRVEQ